MANTTRKNICQPSDWWLAFEAQATTMGYTLSEWIGLNCQSFLTDDVRAGLSERPAANRPTGRRNHQTAVDTDRTVAVISGQSSAICQIR